jgi:hypothetical protein
VVAAPAAAQKPCWQQVIDDWFDDGTVNGTYPVACYRKAIDELPEDARNYSDAPDAINRALQLALDNQGGGGGGGGGGGEGSSPAPAPSEGEQTETGDVLGASTEIDGTADPGETSAGDTGPADTGVLGDAPGNGPIGTALDAAAPDNATSIPLPLIILAAIALLLLAAGAAGIVSKRLQARREQSGGGPPG